MMTVQEWAALISAAASLLVSVASVLHSIATRRQVNTTSVAKVTATNNHARNPKEVT